jgi:hypothetical protein
LMGHEQIPLVMAGKSSSTVNSRWRPEYQEYRASGQTSSVAGLQ